MDVIKVSSKSISQKVAGSIANSFREGSTSVEIQTVGAGAINQAIKAVCIARGYVAPLGYNLICIPAFYDVIIDGKEKVRKIVEFGINLIFKQVFNNLKMIGKKKPAFN